MKIEQQSMEEWRDIPGYAGFYQASTIGRVRGEKRNGSAGKILQPGLKRGYNGVILSCRGSRKAMTIHRLVAMTFLPNENNLPDVNHKDGNKLNNDVSNLEWCTSKWNCLHATRVLGIGSGETNGRAKLTQREVDFLKFIKANYNQISSEVVAKFYGMAGASILLIWNNKNWVEKTLP